LLILIALMGTAFLYNSLDYFYAPLKAANANYTFPTLWELVPHAILYMIPIYIFHILIRKYFMGFTENLLDPKIRKECDDVMLEVYKDKLCATVFKVIFYIFSTVMGLYIFRDHDFFPNQFGGERAVYKFI